MTMLDLPTGCQEHQKITDHNICLANRTTRKGCFLSQLISDRVNRCVPHQAKEHPEEYSPDMDLEFALQEILEDALQEIRKLTSDFLRDQLAWIYYMIKCPLYTLLMNTAERLHHTSHLSVPLAITEAICIYNTEQS